MGLDVLFKTFSGHFMTISGPSCFHLKLFFFNYFLSVRKICAGVFNIFEFELNPLDGGEDMGLCVIFGTFHDNFQVKLFPPVLMCLTFSSLSSIHWMVGGCGPLCAFRVNFQDISVTRLLYIC